MKEVTHIDQNPRHFSRGNRLKDDHSVNYIIRRDFFQGLYDFF